MIIFIIVGIIGISIGLFLLWFAINSEKEYLKKKSRCTAITEGHFIKFNEKEHAESRFDKNHYIKYYYPIYNYFLNNQKYEIESSYGYRTENISSINRQKQIYYNPNKPDESYIANENLNRAYKTVKALGIIFIIAGIIDIILHFIIKSIM